MSILWNTWYVPVTGLVPRETSEHRSLHSVQNLGKRAPVRVLGFGLENELVDISQIWKTKLHQDMTNKDPDILNVMFHFIILF